MEDIQHLSCFLLAVYHTKMTGSLRKGCRLEGEKWPNRCNKVMIQSADCSECHPIMIPVALVANQSQGWQNWNSMICYFRVPFPAFKKGKAKQMHTERENEWKSALLFLRFPPEWMLPCVYPGCRLTHTPQTLIWYTNRNEPASFPAQSDFSVVNSKCRHPGALTQLHPQSS